MPKVHLQITYVEKAQYQHTDHVVLELKIA